MRQEVTERNQTFLSPGDFQAWKADRRQPFKMKDNLSVSLGFAATNNTSKAEPKHASVNAKSAQQKQERKPFDGISSYRSDYVPHPVQPRQRRVNPAHQTTKGRENVESSRPKATCATNQELHDRANEFFEQFKSWSLETKHQGQTTESNLTAEHKFQSTTHADSLAPQHQGSKSALLSRQTSERSTVPFQDTVSMKECCRAWDRPQRNTPLDWPMTTTFSGCKPKPAETNQTSSSLHPRVTENAAFKCSWKETQRNLPPAEKGGFSPFQCTTSMCWSSPLDRGLAWFLAEVKAS